MPKIRKVATWVNINSTYESIEIRHDILHLSSIGEEMKTQIFSGRNALVNLIGFLLLMTTPLLGSPVNKGDDLLVMGLDPVILTQEDLPVMRLTESFHFRGDPESSLIVKIRAVVEWKAIGCSLLVI